MVCCRSSFDGDISERQPEQLNSCIVGGDVAARFDDLAKLRVYALYRIGRIDHASDRRREHEEWDDLLPRVFPGLHDHGVLQPPRGRGELIKRLLRGLSVHGDVDRAQCRGDGAPLLPACIAQAVAD